VVPDEVSGRLLLDEGAGDLVVAVCVVVEQPGRQGDGGVQQRVADRLRPRGHLQEITEAALPELGERVARGALLLGLRRQLVADGEHRHEQVGVDAEQPVGRLPAHQVGDGGPHVAALGDVAGVPEAVHQLRPRLRDVARVPADLPRLSREAVAGQRRQHEVERILGVTAVRGRVGERANRLEQLDD
jgi:hypothetical protein